MIQVAALFVEPGGPYFGLEGVDPWGPPRDARLYAGPHPVVAHPPCERWGRLWWSAKVAARKAGLDEASVPGLGDDGGCFASALDAVATFGGVLEHPEASKAWPHFKLRAPVVREGWLLDPVRSAFLTPGLRAWTCSVDQSRYGHRARKRTWLYYVGKRPPLALDFRPAEHGTTDWCVSGPRQWRALKEVHLLGKKARRLTPLPFRDTLLALARWSMADVPAVEVSDGDEGF